MRRIPVDGLRTEHDDEDEAPMTDHTRARRWLLFVLGGVALLVAGAACAWAVLTVLRPAEDPLASTQHTYVDVQSGEVGASLSLNTVAEWTQSPVGTNQAVGVVTSTDLEPGAEITQGSVLYSVELRPVVVGQGDVPMFRQIGSGTEGSDVRQLQEMLTALGYYDGAADGKAEAGTVAAIKRWQDALGLEETGVVETSDVIFVPRLPTRAVLDSDTIFRGANVSGGEEAVLGLPAEPDFWVSVTAAQAAMIPTGTTVEVASPDGDTWQGIAAEQEPNPDSSDVMVTVTGPEGATLCGDACDQIPVAGQTTLRTSVVTVEQVTGLVVPSSALMTTADGSTVVIDPRGERIPVEVTASANGMSVVSGVDEGTRVQVPAKDESEG